MVAIEFEARCFGLVQYRGGVPGGAEVVPPGIPVLMMVGRLEVFSVLVLFAPRTWER